MLFLRKFLHDDAGASAIEYGLVAALVAVGLITALTSIGGSISNLFDIPSNVYVDNNPDG